MFTDRSRQIAKVFRNQNFVIKELHIGLEPNDSQNPYVIIDHSSYPGVEAHLFTVADSAGWQARFTENHDITLSYPRNNIIGEQLVDSLQSRSMAWNQLTSVLSVIMNCLKLYQEDISHGEFATVVWSHRATEWYRELWDWRIHEYIPSSQFIEYVDVSIRPYIIELNDLGFATLESCSGSMIDHPDREPYRPYVMFDERSYYGSTPHLFTLGDMAGWESMYAPHGFDVYIRVIDGDDIDTAWCRLLESARILSPLLSAYRKSCGQHSNGCMNIEY